MSKASELKKESVVFGEILTNLANEGIIKNMVSNYTLSYDYGINQELRKDMEQEVFIILLEHKDKSKLIQLNHDGYLKAFISGIVKHLVINKHSSFNQKYSRYEAKKVVLIPDSSAYAINSPFM